MANPDESDFRRRGRTTEQALLLQNEVLLGLAKSEAIDSGDLGRAFREITEASSRALGLERVGVWLYADDSKDAMSSPDLFLRSKREHTTAPLLSHTLFPTYFATLALERAIPADDAHTHPATCELSQAYLTPLGIGSLLDAPIRWHGKMVGLVCHEHVGPARRWTQDEINFAGSMADQVARALEAEARLKAQTALAEANRNLELKIARRTQELADKNEQLRRLHGLKDEMFQNVSHELRTPLTLILSPVERLLENPAFAGDERRRLDSIRGNALRLLGLINDVLDLAKLETTKKIDTRPAPLDLGAALARLFADVEEPSRDRGLTATLQVPASLWLNLDERHLERIVLNLLSNAMKFTPRGGALTLSCTVDADAVHLSVKDTGIGIPEGARASIFERFRQLEGGRTRRYEGTGIGLALSAELARLMGGTLRVDSVLGQGSTFTLRLPRSLEVAAPAGAQAPSASAGERLFREAAHAQLRQEAAGPAFTGTRGPLVLVAEDDPGIRRELAELLADRFRVVATQNGEEAFSAAVAQRPHVLISDLMMPDMDGLELVRLVRERPELREMAVIMLSARADLEDRVRGRQLGVDTYLSKPFHGRELRAAVEGLLRSRMRLVGPYLVHERLGAGGQSQVFRAEHLASGAQVALKIISDAGTDARDARERLRREHQTLRRLDHPHIVRVIDEGEEPGGYFLAMEFLAGESLAEVVRNHGPLAAADVVGVGRAIASALEFVHRAGLIHRDIKASNVVVVRGSGPLGPRVRVIDFGTVSNASTVVSDDSLVGTLPYLAPEFFSAGVASPASDVYALGVTLYYLATATMPFRGRSRAELVDHIRHHAPDLSGLGAELANVVARAMAHEVANRFTTAQALEEALAALRPASPEAPRSAADVPTGELRRDASSTL